MDRKGILDTMSRSQIRANNPWQTDIFLLPQLTVILLDGWRPFREVLEEHLLWSNKANALGSPVLAISAYDDNKDHETKWMGT